MSETTPRPGPELFPQTEQGPANDHRSPYANSRLEHVHADTRLSERTREIALLLLRMPSGIREVTYRGARSAASDPGGLVTALRVAAAFHELDQIYPAPEQPAPVEVPYPVGTLVEVNLGTARALPSCEDCADPHPCRIHGDDWRRAVVVKATGAPAGHVEVDVQGGPALFTLDRVRAPQ